ncbi:MAG TPA: lipocalin family protein [Chthoniobacter sp.]|jgi:apolipoprotein D and lipocalin family protein
MNLIRSLLWFPAVSAAFLLVGGCSQEKPLPTVHSVDLHRYLGKWFEIAHAANRFQRADEQAVAEYSPLSATSVRVHNTAHDRNGKTRTIEGTAEVVPGSNGARLRVKFGGFAALAPVSKDGNYWIIDLDPQYRSAMVGTPDRQYLWILARSPALDPATLKFYLIPSFINNVTYVREAGKRERWLE